MSPETPAPGREERTAMLDNTICPVPFGAKVRSSLLSVVMSVAAPEKISPVEPIVLFVRVCAWLAKTKVSFPDSAGIVAILDAPGATELIVVVFVVPNINWLVGLARESAAKVGDEVASMSCGSERVMVPAPFATLI